MTATIPRGIILAGGLGNRLYPASRAVSKQLLTVYDKPMIYYPLATLMAMNIRDYLIIVNEGDLERFESLLGDGSRLGISIRFLPEKHPLGIANAFLIGKEFICDEPVALILGDNIFCDSEAVARLAGRFEGNALTFGVRVTDPHEYGVAEIDENGRVLSIEEKPDSPRSDIAVTGLYLYDADVVRIARGIKPSGRGELEITDVNNAYLAEGRLELVVLDDTAVWFDTGTADSIVRAGNYIASVETTSGRRVGCIEQIAYQQGFINHKQLRHLADEMPAGGYRDYLMGLE